MHFHCIFDRFLRFWINPITVHFGHHEIAVERTVAEKRQDALALHRAKSGPAGSRHRYSKMNDVVVIDEGLLLLLRKPSGELIRGIHLALPAR